MEVVIIHPNVAFRARSETRQVCNVRVHCDAVRYGFQRGLHGKDISMRILIMGATGFIGKALCKLLIKEGHEILALSRNPKKAAESFPPDIPIIEWDGRSTRFLDERSKTLHGIVNLAGENIGTGRWSRTKKRQILESRVHAGRALVEAVRHADQKPKVVVQASAIGFYGSTHDEVLDESSPSGTGFLAEAGQQWESSSKEVESLGCRRVIIRSGVVLGTSGGVLPKLLRPFRLFLGGPPGNGSQWFSWIHLEDEILAIRFLLEKEDAHGVYNLTTPEPLTMRRFCRVLGKTMNRPSWIPVPAPIVRLVLGEMGKELLLSGQRVIPKRLLEAGYQFLYPDAETALAEILRDIRRRGR